MVFVSSVDVDIHKSLHCNLVIVEFTLSLLYLGLKIDKSREWPLARPEGSLKDAIKKGVPPQKHHISIPGWQLSLPLSCIQHISGWQGLVLLAAMFCELQLEV